MTNEAEDPDRLSATFFERVPGSDRESLFVAVDLSSVDADPGEIVSDWHDDVTLWMYVEGDDPQGPDIAYFEVDEDMTRIIGRA